MPKQQIQTDIAEASQEYGHHSSCTKSGTRPIRLNAPPVLKEHLIDKDIVKAEEFKPTIYPYIPLTKKEIELIEKRDDTIYAFGNFQGKCFRSITCASLSKVNFDVWWFINGRSYLGTGKSYDVYKELIDVTGDSCDLVKIRQIFYRLREFKVEDFKSRSNYTAVFLFDLQRSGKANIEIKLKIVDDKPTSFVLQGSYIVLPMDKNTLSVDFSKLPENKVVEIHGHVKQDKVSSPLLAILEQPYF